MHACGMQCARARMQGMCLARGRQTCHMQALQRNAARSGDAPRCVRAHTERCSTHAAAAHQWRRCCNCRRCRLRPLSHSARARRLRVVVRGGRCDRQWRACRGGLSVCARRHRRRRVHTHLAQQRARLCRGVAQWRHPHQQSWVVRRSWSAAAQRLWRRRRRHARRPRLPCCGGAADVTMSHVCVAQAARVERVSEGQSVCQ
jgi:hypothetical protein